jgi:DNA-directed RNA polymerase subunit M/transcription elongation factor TFIIS
MSGERAKTCESGRRDQKEDLTPPHESRMCMASARSFVRHCPSCGKHFSIRLVSKVAVDEESIFQQVPRVVRKRANPIIAVEEGGPMVYHTPELEDETDFKLTYKCKHCGYVWSEQSTQIKELVPEEDYSGD